MDRDCRPRFHNLPLHRSRSTIRRKSTQSCHARMCTAHDRDWGNTTRWCRYGCRPHRSQTPCTGMSHRIWDPDSTDMCCCPRRSPSGTSFRTHRHRFHRRPLRNHKPFFALELLRPTPQPSHTSQRDGPGHRDRRSRDRRSQDHPRTGSRTPAEARGRVPESGTCTRDTGSRPRGESRWGRQQRYQSTACACNSSFPVHQAHVLLVNLQQVCCPHCQRHPDPHATLCAPGTTIPISRADRRSSI